VGAAAIAAALRRKLEHTEDVPIAVEFRGGGPGVRVRHRRR
jgi:hypothetical protein